MRWRPQRLDEAAAGLLDTCLAEVDPEPGVLWLWPLASAGGVSVGPTLGRRPELLEALRALPGLGAIHVSPVGGTIGPAGRAWLNLLGMARLPADCPFPLDRLTATAHQLLQRRLAGREVVRGRVDGSWCPGFSDLSVEGRKLVGIGFKLTARWAALRLVVAVRPPSASEFSALHQAHQLIGTSLRRSALTSLAQLMPERRWDPTEALRWLGGPRLR